MTIDRLTVGGPRLRVVVGALACVAAMLAAPAVWPNTASAAPLRTGTTGVTWNLVARTCATGQIAAGRGCWDQQALDRSTWQVNENSATWQDTTFGAEMEWQVPTSISPSKANIPLNVTANDYTNNSGINVQLCVASPFPTTPLHPGDPCARASAPTPHTSGSGSNELTLDTISDYPPGYQVTLTVELGDGGNVLFTYQSQAVTLKQVDFTFRATFQSLKPDAPPTPLWNVAMKGGGSFGAGESSGVVTGQSPKGSAAIELGGKNGSYITVKLALVKVEYSPNRVAATYRVTQSHGSNCLLQGSRHLIVASRFNNKSHVAFGFCKASNGSFRVSTSSVTINAP